MNFQTMDLHLFFTEKQKMFLYVRMEMKWMAL